MEQQDYRPWHEVSRMDKREIQRNVRLRELREKIMKARAKRPSE